MPVLLLVLRRRAARVKSAEFFGKSSWYLPKIPDPPVILVVYGAVIGGVILNRR
jgi:hypothetical protein